MAQTIGDGPNRGKSAPRPLPRPKPNAPRTVEEAAKPWSRWRHPFGEGTSYPSIDNTTSDWDLSHPPALAPRGKEAVQLRADQAAAPGFHKAERDRTASMYQAMADRQKKDEKRIAREKKDRKETDVFLTDAQWAKLTPLQQAAAQANADLDEAIHRDFKTQGKHTANSSQKEGGTQRIQGYLKRVQELFGDDGNSDFKGLEFAPNTLAFLESRGIDKKDLHGKTLDDLVSGDALIDEKTFKSLGEVVPDWTQEETPFGSMDVRADERGRNIQFAQELAKGQLQYQERLAQKLKRGDQLLQGVTSQDTSALAGSEFGAKGIPAHAKMTVVRPELAARIDTYMEILARPDIPVDESLDSIGAELMERKASDKEMAQIWDNLIERARHGATGEGKWFDNVDFKMRTPQDVAKALGVTSLKRAGAK